MKQEGRVPKIRPRAAKIIGAISAAVIIIIGAYFFLKKEGEPRLAVQEELTAGSITDLFSDSRWVDKEKSSLVQNIATDAIVFSPKFTWKEAEGVSWEKGAEEEQSGLEAVKGGISKFFDAAIMRGGFSPRIIRGSQVWYVWSGDERKPVLLKLYEDAEGNIVGIFDFSEILFPAEVSGIEVQRGSGKGELMVLVKKDPDPASVFIFQDQGFEKETEKSVVSKNMNPFPAEVRHVRIAEAEMYLGKGESVQFYLSTDGENWRKTEIEKEEVFEKGNGIFWRADLKPNANTYESSAIQSIHLEYSLYFPEGFEAYKKRQAVIP